MYLWDQSFKNPKGLYLRVLNTRLCQTKCVFQMKKLFLWQNICTQRMPFRPNFLAQSSQSMPDLYKCFSGGERLMTNDCWDTDQETNILTLNSSQFFIAFAFGHRIAYKLIDKFRAKQTNRKPIAVFCHFRDSLRILLSLKWYICE